MGERQAIWRRQCEGEPRTVGALNLETTIRRGLMVRSNWRLRGQCWQGQEGWRWQSRGWRRARLGGGGLFERVRMEAADAANHGSRVAFK